MEYNKTWQFCIGLKVPLEWGKKLPNPLGFEKKKYPEKSYYLSLPRKINLWWVHQLLRS